MTFPPAEFEGEFRLSELGLFTDIEEKRLSDAAIEFEPEYHLWSDGADKRRWLMLPPGERIDTSDPEHWMIPIGARAFKQFSADGKRLETRLIARTGPGPEDYWMGAFAWLEDESDALFVPGGQQNVRGTAFDVPKMIACGNCHDSEPGRILGFSAVQQPGADPGLLTEPLAEPFRVPGDDTVSRALGYLHANCGHCHNPNGAAWAREVTMNLRLDLDARTPEDTEAYDTTIGVELEYFEGADLTYRVVPGAPAESAIFFRMSQRTGASASFAASGEKLQMPPIATELEDRVGMDLIQRWIQGL